MAQKIKLFTLRLILIILLTIVEVSTLVVKKRYHYPIKWLNHFLKGSGKAMRVPEKLVQEAKLALMQAIHADSYENNYWWSGDLRGKYCVYHSTLYEGSGFHGRPSLFYILGGFTFRLYLPKDIDEDAVIVSGNDYYDWHTTECGSYFTSPLGKSKPIILLIRILGKIFGNDLFVTEGFPMGEPGISNKLWEEMYKVGAKSFHSYFKNVTIHFTPDEWDYIWGGEDWYE